MTIVKRHITSRSLTAQPIAAFLAALLFGVFSGTSHAQSESDLRRENQALRAQLQDTEAELDAAREQIRELEAEIRRLNAELQAERSGRSTPAPPVEPEVTVDESEPAATPRALLRTVQETYQERFEDMDLGEPGSPERASYLRNLSRWANQINRQYREQVNWHARFIETVPVQGNPAIRIVAIDPITHVELGDEFIARIASRPLARRLESQLERQRDNIFQFRGVLHPQVQVNERRETAGTFNKPPFVGPFVEFVLGAEITAVMPPIDPEEARAESEDDDDEDEQNDDDGNR